MKKLLLLILLLIPSLAFGEGKTIMLQYGYGGPDFSGLTVDLIPATDDTYDIGSATKEWKDLYVDGTANLDNTDIDGTLTVSPDGNETFQVNDGTVDFTDGNAGTAGTATVDSSGNISYNKNIAATDLDGIIGSNTPAAITGTTITANTSLVFNDQDASPSNVGEMLYDNSVTGITDGALSWYDDDEVRYVIDSQTPRSQVNLLTNSGFGVWSNSTLEDVRNLPDSTTTVSGTTCTSTANLLSAGMLVTDDTDACFEVMSITDANTFEVDRTGASSGTQWQEVTPGIVSTTTDGPDGWGRTTSNTGMDFWREYDGSNTKEGSFYALKVTNAAGANQGPIWPNNSTYNVSGFYERFQGRTVTFGCWIKASSGSTVNLEIVEDTTSESSQNIGTGYEWLEVTKTISTTASQFYVLIDIETGNTAYISQPMLVFGSSIGEGNYVQPPGEVVWLESIGDLTDWASVSVSSSYGEIINLESQSAGKIPKGIKSININIRRIKASAATSGQDFTLKDVSGNYPSLSIFATTTNANSVAGFVPCDSNGDIYCATSASVTWSEVALSAIAVQVAP